MITLRAMRWSNMFSYGDDNYLDFTKYKLVQLVGKNGHGKSSIPHILEELLFNKNSKGYKKASILNRYSTKKIYSGEVFWDIDNTEYHLKVIRTGATQKVILLKNNEDISQHTPTATYDLIEKMFGTNFKTTSQIILQNLQSSLQFLTATDTNRKKFLIELLNLESYMEKHEIFKDIHKTISDRAKLLEGELSGIVNWVVEKSKISLNSVELLDEVPEPTEEKQRLDNLRLEINNVDKTIAQIRLNNQYKAMRDEVPLHIISQNAVHIDTATISNEIAVLQSKIKDYTLEVTKIKGLQGKCHTCLRPVDNEFNEALIRNNKAESISLNVQLTAYRDKLISISANNELHAKSKKASEDFEKYSSLIDNNLPAEEPNIIKLKSEYSLLSTDYESKILTKKKIAGHNERARATNVQVELIASQLDEMKNKVTELQNRLDKEVGLCSKLEVLKKSFSPNGLPAYKIENSVKDLEDITNTYLEELSDGRFQLFFIINNDKLNVVIKDNGIDVEIVALSTGELTRVTTATLLAIRKLMTTLSKTKINILFLDETVDVLDDEGKEKLVEILLKETDLNTFLVSHGYAHPLLKKTHVIKSNNISKLQDD